MVTSVTGHGMASPGAGGAAGGSSQFRVGMSRSSTAMPSRHTGLAPKRGSPSRSTASAGLTRSYPPRLTSGASGPLKDMTCPSTTSAYHECPVRSPSTTWWATALVTAPPDQWLWVSYSAASASRPSAPRVAWSAPVAASASGSSTGVGSAGSTGRATPGSTAGAETASSPGLPDVPSPAGTASSSMGSGMGIGSMLSNRGYSSGSE